MHPDVLLDSLTARQWKGWIEFSGIEPLGEMRADLRAGIIAATISNRLRGKNEQSTEPIDYMPFFERPKQTATEILSVIRQAKEQANGTSRRHIN